METMHRRSEPQRKLNDAELVPGIHFGACGKPEFPQNKIVNGVTVE